MWSLTLGQYCITDLLASLQTAAMLRDCRLQSLNISSGYCPRCGQVEPEPTKKPEPASVGLVHSTQAMARTGSGPLSCRPLSPVAPPFPFLCLRGAAATAV